MYELIRLLSFSLGISWASGLNLYAAVAMLGILGATGHIHLPEQLQMLQESQYITGALIMYCIEFFADKIPIVDSIWDGIHSFIRVPIGAALMSYALGDINPMVTWTAYFVGGMLTGAVHIGKAGTRILVNTSPEPYSNWFLSFSEDIAVIAGLYASIFYPAAFLVFIFLFFGMLMYLLPIIWRAILGDFVGLRLKLRGKRGMVLNAAVAGAEGKKFSRSAWSVGAPIRPAAERMAERQRAAAARATAATSSAAANAATAAAKTSDSGTSSSSHPPTPGAPGASTSTSAETSTADAEPVKSATAEAAGTHVMSAENLDSPSNKTTATTSAADSDTENISRASSESVEPSDLSPENPKSPLSK